MVKMIINFQKKVPSLLVSHFFVENENDMILLKTRMVEIFRLSKTTLYDGKYIDNDWSLTK
jgi:hypothetical protein